MNNVFRLISLLLVLSLISCRVSKKEESEKPLPKPTESKVVSDVQTEAESISPSRSVKLSIPLKGFENLTFGMTEAETRAAYKGSLNMDDDAGNPNCYYLYQNGTDIFYMINFGTLERIDVYNSPNIITKEGARIGMSFEDIEKTYTNAHRKPNFYTYPAEDLIVQLDENIKVIFEQGAD